MNRLFQIAKNKYFLAGTAFVVWMCFFDRYDVSTRYHYTQQKKGLEKEEQFYENEIERISIAIKDMQYNPEEIQRVAREKYKMKKKNEDIYVLEIQKESE